MNKKPFNFTVVFLLLLAACNQMSEQVSDQSAGLNGGFEITRHGLPVNWLIYTPNTVPQSDFEIILDNTNYKEGKQSLRFEVKECSATGGWHSPGFTNEFSEVGKYEGPARYRLSFWIKNNGSRFEISAGIIGLMEREMKTLLEGNHEIDDWQFFEYEMEIPAKKWLGLQLNILKPGTFWIDDIKIEKL